MSEPEIAVPGLLVRRALAALIAGAAACAPAASAPEAPTTTPDSIASHAPPAQTLASGLGDVREFIAVGGYVYWLEGGDPGAILRAPEVPGYAPTRLASPHNPSGLAVDSDGNVYYGEDGLAIRKIVIDAQHPELSYTTDIFHRDAGQGDRFCLAYFAGNIFFGINGSTPGVWRTTTEGSAAESVDQGQSVYGHPIAPTSIVATAGGLMAWKAGIFEVGTRWLDATTPATRWSTAGWRDGALGAYGLTLFHYGSWRAVEMVAFDGAGAPDAPPTIRRLASNPDIPLGPLAADATRVYWARGDAIASTHWPEDDRVDVLASDEPDVRGLAVDDGRVVWTATHDGQRALRLARRSDLRRD